MVSLSIYGEVFHAGRVIVDNYSRQLEPLYEKTIFLHYAKTKTQISFAVTAKLISTFVLST